MAKVHLRKITVDNFQECISLEVNENQKEFLASNVKSLAQAYVNPNLYPLAIYDAAVMGYIEPQLPMIGFTMYEIVGGIGFILRLMIDSKYQQQGYGKATILEVIRRLKLYPEVELIATSYKKGNEAASKFYRRLRFIDWHIEWAVNHEAEVYLKLDS
ncbi:acetyltransferase [Rivularia sp. PCC 7116]|uniref:GNAT family N-acetyltransferase n=1 Tax=Rivularia sp. PCC 7116 TaxID=373994 RepID=UPI00029EDA7C|nr:GNAT family N-acetyltransferase [Rivularia sp. PCC 7116]AFY53699.1 acetyltransferase [Rivularia sp. PCC 7116]